MAYPYSDNEFSFGVNLLLVKFVPKYAPYLTLAGAPAGGIRLVGCYPRGGILCIGIFWNIGSPPPSP